MYHARWINYFNINYLNILDKKLVGIYLFYADHIGTVCMTFFFFISAFWLYKSPISIKIIMKRNKKRLKTLLVPFVLWTIIISLYKIYILQIDLSGESLFYYFFQSPIAGPLWYLLGLLILQTFSPLIAAIHKHKKITTIIYIIIISYLLLRIYGTIPHLLTFENWWWYNNLLYYLPAYMIGSYIGLYYQEIITKYKYEKKYTIIGIFLIIISLILWYYYDKRFLIIYSLLELIGIWFLMKPKLFKINISKLSSCQFYIFALHNPILIPLTKKLIETSIGNKEICGIEVILIKLLQIIIIVLMSCIIKYIFKHIFSKKKLMKA